MVGLVLLGGAAWGQLAGGGEVHRAAGQLGVVDAAAGRVELHTGERTLQLRVGPSTPILLPGRLGALEELAPGQRVRAAFQETEELPAAAWIEVTAQPAGLRAD